MPHIVVFKKLSETAVIPARATEMSAGFDLTADETLEVIEQSNGVVRVNTGISILSMPAGCYARVAMRSGLAVRNHFVIDAGVIDADYRGPIVVCFHTVGPDEYTVNKGDRIAQLIFERITCPETIVANSDDADAAYGDAGNSTTPVHAGFGSTGV